MQEHLSAESWPRERSLKSSATEGCGRLRRYYRVSHAREHSLSSLTNQSLHQVRINHPTPRFINLTLPDHGANKPPSTLSRLRPLLDSQRSRLRLHGLESHRLRLR